MHGMFGSEKIDRFNRELYRLLKPKLLAVPPGDGRSTTAAGRTATHHGFFDQVEISRGLEDWSVDGVHMKGDWYEQIVSYILQIVCFDSL